MIFYATFDNEKHWFTIRCDESGNDRRSSDYIVADCIRSASIAEHMVEWLNSGAIDWCIGHESRSNPTNGD